MIFKRIIKTYRNSFAGLPRDAWLLALALFINRAGSMVLFFLSLYLTQKLGFTVAEVGQMISIYGLGSLIGAYSGGWLTDKMGSIRVQYFSLVLSAIGYLVLGYMTTYYSFAIVLFFTALVNDALRPANNTAISEVCPPELRSRGFALNRLAINVGVSIGPAVGGFLALINYSYLFWVDGVTCFAGFLMLFYFYGNKKHFRVLSGTPEKQISRSPYKDYFYLYILSMLLLIGFLFVQFFNTWPLYLRDFYFLQENQIGMLVALNAILVSILEMPLIHILERKNNMQVIAWGSLLLFSGFAVLPFAQSFAYAIITVVIWTFGEMLVFPLTAGLIANRATDANRGKYMGLFSLNFSLAFVFGPMIGSTIYNNLGGDMLWYIAGLTGVFVWFNFMVGARLKTRDV